MLALRYAGHYVPTLAKAIMDHNAKYPVKLNLQGFAVGNPLTNEVVRVNIQPRRARARACLCV
jgi:carboxypeptidase C (cathepsin A)